MISLHIADTKSFMGKLLLQNVFDNFLLTEMEINTFTKFTVQGRLNRNYYSTDELEILGDRALVKWSEIKPFAYQLVKGNKTPLSFQIILQLSEENTEKMLLSAGIKISASDISGLYMHLKFEGGILHIITGVGLKTFSLDKTLDLEWDEMVKRFLKHNEVLFENE